MDLKLKSSELDADGIGTVSQEAESPLNRFLQKKNSTLGFKRVSGVALLKEKVDEQTYVVELEEGSVLTVKKAISCIHQVNVGDIVLVDGSESRAYITALLESSESSIDIEVETFNLKATELNFDSKTASFETESYSVTSVSYRINSINLDMKSQKMTSLAKFFSESYTMSEKFVAEVDKVQAMNINYSAEMLARIDGHTTVINAKELLKTDAKLIVSG
ncbi:hypothetical protein RP300_01641 [Oligella urethralis]|uniref:Protein of uncharacterized function (DUF3540) n=1 Tax=Oligella urethralis TaxID=90245 RepID=A0A2N6QGU6_9BURK|nr:MULTISPECIES: DUF3540 domain-containing protein [Oligella]AVL71430.1 DUF3540 domain-containing protein [Oligella urethralis]MDK6201975.1 DUF3540 domain-containing protein [Oligella urethralis]OFV51582.1 hypothetical protein HMPREF3179_00065 [Oligella sp. HMSC09E12]PMC18740.1 DUF3540 domain-containing protein [Oligella urethralis]WOS38076.1 hypothetical protein RP300_01641 [Oligella urethralis]